MSAMRWLGWALLCAGALGACGGSGEEDEHADEHADEHGDEGAEPDGHEAESEAEGEHGEDVLRVDATMLRDLRITTGVVEERPGGEAVIALGELHVHPDRHAEVGVPLASRVVAALVLPGDRVEEGQVLAVLESAEVGHVRSGVGASRAALALAEQTLARRRELAAEGIIAAREVEQAEAAVASARAEAAGSRGAARVVGRGAPGRLSVEAPIAGTVLERDAPLGAMLEPGRRLFRIGDLSSLWLIVHAFERDAVRIAPGAPARIALAALPGRTFEGTVARVGGEVESASRTVEVRIDLANEEGAFLPGMSATAWLPVGAEGESLLAVPAIALQRLEESWVAFVPGEHEGEFEIRRVGRGRDLGDEVEIQSGLRAGERVVVQGAFLLKSEAERASGGGGEHHHH